jgi:hypothetical protein
VASIAVAELRVLRAAGIGGDRLEVLLNDLLANAPEFASRWIEQRTFSFEPFEMVLRHSRLGVLRVDLVRLRVVSPSDATISVLLPRDSATAEQFSCEAARFWGSRRVGNRPRAEPER